MRWALRWAWLPLLVAGCDRVFGIAPVADAAPACMSPLVPGVYTPQLLFPNQKGPSLSLDQSLMYVTNLGEISYSRYTGTWSPPVPIPSLDATGMEDHPFLTYDAQTLYFTRQLPGDYDQPYIAQRASDAEEWQPAVPLAYPSALRGNDVVFGTPNAAGDHIIASHGLLMHYHLAELVFANDAWFVLDTTSALYPLGSDVSDTSPQLMPDGCAIVFARRDNNGPPGAKIAIMLATRGADGTFEAAVPLVTNTIPQDAQHPWLSPDGAMLYFFDSSGDSVFVAPRS